MTRELGLPFDPIERAGDLWERAWGPATTMRAATSVFRVQQILLGRYDELLRDHDLTFARYEALVLLRFSRKEELPMKVIGSRLMVHPTSVTNTVARLVTSGFVTRRRNPTDGRGVLAALTDSGRTVVEVATAELRAIDFALSDVPAADLAAMVDTLAGVRKRAGDFR